MVQGSETDCYYMIARFMFNNFARPNSTWWCKKYSNFLTIILHKINFQPHWYTNHLQSVVPPGMHCVGRTGTVHGAYLRWTINNQWCEMRLITLLGVVLSVSRCNRCFAISFYFCTDANKYQMHDYYFHHCFRRPSQRQSTCIHSSHNLTNLSFCCWRCRLLQAYSSS